MKESVKKQRKINIVQKLENELAQSESAIIVDYQGLSTNNLNLLRQAIKITGNQITAVKKNLLKIALQSEKKFAPLSNLDYKGQTALLTLKNRPLDAIKSVKNFSDKYGKPSFCQGIFNGNTIDSLQFEQLALIPPYDTLISQTAYVLKNPINRLILNFKGNEQRLVFSLKALSNKKTD